MQKRVTILMGSPRQAGNTALLAKAFQEGASQAGHAVRLVDLGALTIAPCLACDVCLENGGRCVIDDDMQPVHDLVVASDVLVFATPLYYSTYSGQMKCCLDRLRQREKNSVYQVRQAALLVVSAASDPAAIEPIAATHAAVVKGLGWENLGVIAAQGVWAAGAAAGRPALEQARRMGLAL